VRRLRRDPEGIRLMLAAPEGRPELHSPARWVGPAAAWKNRPLGAVCDSGRTQFAVVQAVSLIPVLAVAK
jgi:hypothetical protein